MPPEHGPSRALQDQVPHPADSEEGCRVRIHYPGSVPLRRPLSVTVPLRSYCALNVSTSMLVTDSESKAADQGACIASACHLGAFERGSRRSGALSSRRHAPNQGNRS
jgi:hypothetical protein